MATIVIPTLGTDADKLAICLMSINHFLDPTNFKLLIITPIEDKLTIKKSIQGILTKNIPLDIITDDMVLPDPDSYSIKWARIQILKLLCAMFVETPFFLILNSSNILTKPLSIINIIQDNKAVMEMGEPGIYNNLEQAFTLFGDVCPNPSMSMMRMTPAILSTFLTKDMFNFLQKKQQETSVQQFLYNTVPNVAWYVIYFAYYQINKNTYNPHIPGQLHSQYSIDSSYNFLYWNPFDVFSPTNKGYFFITNTSWNVPAEIIFDQFRDYIGYHRNNSQFPKISCILVTQNRLNYAMQSIRDYQKQTYPNKELIVVCDQEDGVKDYITAINDTTIILKQLPQLNRTTGELRDIGIQACTGDYVVHWDDNDWSHSSRISVQYNLMKYTGTDGCILTNMIMAYPEKQMFSISKNKQEGWQKTLMVKREKMISYQSDEYVNIDILSGYAKIFNTPSIDYAMLYICYPRKWDVSNSMKSLEQHLKSNSQKVMQNISSFKSTNKEFYNPVIKPSKLVITENDKTKIQFAQIFLLAVLNLYLLYKILQSV
jgi:glycosyltransferase involved in cell wall biosynthesis